MSIQNVHTLQDVQHMLKLQQQIAKQYPTSVSVTEMHVLKPKNVKNTHNNNVNQHQVSQEFSNVNGIQILEHVEITLVQKLIPV